MRCGHSRRWPCWSACPQNSPSSQDLSHLGLIPDPVFGWPVGFSRNKVRHLGGLSAVGLNCAVCHVGEVTPPGDGARLRVLGMTSHFDAEAFFGSLIVSTFRTADPANMKKFLAAWLSVNDPAGGDKAQELYATEWQRQDQRIAAAISADRTGSMDLAPGTLHKISGDELRLNRKLLAKGMDLPALAHSTLKLFHNMRSALHVPDQPPPPSPPNGPGRNDPWRILSFSLLGVVTDPAPVKFGIVWNEDQGALRREHPLARYPQPCRVARPRGAAHRAPRRPGFRARKAPNRFDRTHTSAALSLDD